MNTLLLTSLLISLFCVGLRIISSKGMILRFLRKPYELLGNNRSTKVAILKQLLSEKVESKKKFDEYAKGDLVNVKELVSYKDLAQGKFEAYENYRKNNKNYIFWSGITLYIMKPIIGCCTCMASVWTLVCAAPDNRLHYRVLHMHGLCMDTCMVEVIR